MRVILERWKLDLNFTELGSLTTFRVVSDGWPDVGFIVKLIEIVLWSNLS